MGGRKYVSASDIGSCGFCAYQLHLRKIKGDDRSTKKRLKAGDDAHRQFNKGYRTKGVLKPLVALFALAVLWFLYRVIL